MKQVEIFNHLGSIITDNGMCDTEIPMAQRISEKCIPKIKQSNKTQENFVRKEYDCYIIFNLLYGSECWLISSQMQIEAKETWFY